MQHLGLSDESWPYESVRVVLEPKSSTGEAKYINGTVVKPSLSGDVQVRVNQAGEATVRVFDVSQLLLNSEEFEAIWGSRDHVAVAMAKALQKNGADLNAKDDKGQTALLKALLTGKTDLALWLLAQGVELSLCHTLYHALHTVHYALCVELTCIMHYTAL